MESEILLLFIGDSKMNCHNNLPHAGSSRYQVLT